MARLPRLALAGELHLVLQRGHNRQPIFTDDADRSAYLLALTEAAAASGLAVHAYALLDSEVHLLATPSEAAALSRTMQTLGRRYVAGYNARHGRSGTLWEGRFRATVVEAARYLDCLQYIEQSPGLAADGRWSSLPHHLGRRRDPLVTDPAAFWALGNTPFEREAAYRRRLEAGLSSEARRVLAEAQQKGWAVGGEAFLARLAKATDRPLAPRPRGRPRKQPVNAMEAKERSDPN